jgi:hypothetical protein
MVNEAAWADCRIALGGKVIDLRRGQFSHSYRYMAEAWGWGIASVHRFIKRLETETMIGTQTGTVSGTAQLVITICNYDKYQPAQNKAERDAERKAERAAEQQRNREERHLEKEKRVGKSLTKEANLLSLGAVGKPTAARLPLDWVLPAPWGEWAVAEGWQAQAVRREAECFRDYWHSRGAGAAKVDWQATWRNWIRKAKPPPYRNGSTTETPRLGAQEEIW